MFSHVEMTPVFPTCVWLHEVAAAAAINPPMLAEVGRLMACEASKAKVAGTWQSGGELYRNAAFEPLVQLAAEAAKGVVRFLAWACEGLQITDMWANVNHTGHGARPHTHPNNFLAGVYYLQVPPESGELVLYDPRPAANVLAPAVRERNVYNMARQAIQAQEGRLVIFPAWLQHSVVPNRSPVDRVSIAFNLALKGLIGGESGRVHF